MTEDLIKSWIKFLDTNYDIGHVNYYYLDFLDSKDLSKYLLGYTAKAFKLKVYKEYVALSEKNTKQDFTQMISSMDELKFKTDLATHFLNEKFNATSNLKVKELLLLIAYSDILDDFYTHYHSYTYEKMKHLSNFYKYEKATFSCDITIRSAKAINEPISFNMTSSFKTLYNDIISAILERLIINKDGYICSINIYYKHPITQEYTFYTSKDYTFTYKDNEWYYE